MTTPVHHMTIDVEEYFHVSAFERHVSRAHWPRMERRVEEVLPLLLDWMAEVGAMGTFFVLGWTAERAPELVRRIANDGHEVASHGWDHARVTQLDPDAFRRQARDSRALLEDLTGQPVRGFRAPSFSIVPGREWALQVLVEEGYSYDSSLYPVRRPGYGYPGGPRDIYRLDTPAGPLLEVPPATLRMAGMNIPAGGGGTFRQFPYGFTRAALRAAERRGEPATFYLHPWELDPAQPRLSGLPYLTRVRHYRGLDRAGPRLRRLLSEFRFQSIRKTLARREE